MREYIVILSIKDDGLDHHGKPGHYLLGGTSGTKRYVEEHIRLDKGVMVDILLVVEKSKLEPDR